MRLSATQQDKKLSCVRARRTEATASGVRNDLKIKKKAPYWCFFFIFLWPAVFYKKLFHKEPQIQFFQEGLVAHIPFLDDTHFQQQRSNPADVFHGEKPSEFQKINDMALRDLQLLLNKPSFALLLFEKPFPEDSQGY